MILFGRPIKILPIIKDDGTITWRLPPPRLRHKGKPSYYDPIVFLPMTAPKFRIIHEDSSVIEAAVEAALPTMLTIHGIRRKSRCPPQR